MESDLKLSLLVVLFVVCSFFLKRDASPGRVALRFRAARFRGRIAPVVAAVALAGLVSASPAGALSVSEAYLFADWSAPTTTTGAPFVLTPTQAFELSLNASGVATSATAVSAPASIAIADRLYYQSHTGTIDPNEVTPSALASRVNSEIAKVDDAGIVSPTLDAALNIDFKSGATVTLRPATLPVTSLVIFEDAGLDPFSLRYCYDAGCTLYDILFNGFTSSTTSTLLASNAIGVDDSDPGIDQAYWFVFDEAVTGGYFRIGDTQNFGGILSERLEIDFAGTTTIAPVPEPATLGLLGLGLLGLPFLRRKQTA